jgi:hypothetical protein
MVDGHSSMVSWLKMDISLLRNALHTKERLRGTLAQTMRVVLHIQKSKKQNSLVKDMEIPVKRK